MKKEDIWKRLTDIFRDLFDDPSITIEENTTADDIEDWDSFEHINLIVAIEEEFSFKFPMGKVSCLKNVGEMVDIILELGK